MKKILLLGIIFPATAFLFAQSPKSKAVLSDSAEFRFEVSEYSFNPVNEGDMVNYDFHFTNAGKTPMIITGADASCGCTAPEYPRQPVKSGEKAVIKVTFNSTGKSGYQDKTVTVTSNAKNSPYILHLKGTVVAKTDPGKKPE